MLTEGRSPLHEYPPTTRPALDGGAPGWLTAVRVAQARGPSAPGGAVASLVARGRFEERIGPVQGSAAMLVPTRRVGEVIVIGSAICITVVSVRGKQRSPRGRRARVGPRGPPGCGS